MDMLAEITLQDVAEFMNIGWAGYLVLFGLLFSCGLGMPLPEDIPLMVAGMLIGQGKMHLAVAGICAWCGIIGGDCVLYYLGHRYGLNITRLPMIGKHVTKERILQAERLFDRWGIWVVGVGRLFAGIRGAMVVAAGTIRYSFIKFIIADGLAALVSGGLFIWLGMKFGQNLDYIQKKIHGYDKWIVWGVVILVAGIIAYYLWRRRGHRKPSEIAVDVVVDVAEHGLHLPRPNHPNNPADSTVK